MGSVMSKWNEEESENPKEIYGGYEDSNYPPKEIKLYIGDKTDKDLAILKNTLKRFFSVAQLQSIDLLLSHRKIN